MLLYDYLKGMSISLQLQMVMFVSDINFRVKVQDTSAFYRETLLAQL